jgi:hypothetical protein
MLDALHVLSFVGDGCRISREREVPIPVWHDTHVLAVRQQVAARRKLIDPRKRRTVGRMPEELHIVQRLQIPTERHTEFHERLHLGGEVEHPVVDCVIHRLDAEPVARGEQRTVPLVPDSERELTSQ